MLNGVPATCEPMVLNEKLDAVAGLTVIELLVAGLVPSVTVIVWDPAVYSVKPDPENVATPLSAAVNE